MSNHIYSPYGAFELKASYYKNLLIGNLYVLCTALIFISVYYVSLLLQGEKPVIISTSSSSKEVSKDIPPPPTIIRDNFPSFEPRQPMNQEIPQYSIPVAIEDSLFIEDEIIEMRTITDPAPLTGSNGTDEEDYPFDFDRTNGGFGDGQVEYIPEPDTFIPYEKPPEMIHKEMPVFPRLCQSIGLEGTVWLHVYVGINGDVLDVRIAKSSDNESFDSAAKNAAYKNKYSPAIQNGNPIALWIGYKVEFKLDR